MWDVKGLTREWKKTVFKYKYVLLLVGVGIVFLLWPTGSSQTPPSTAVSEEETFSVSDVEEKIAQVLSQAAGVGHVSVALTLKSGLETIVSKDTQSNQHRDMDNDKLVSYDLETREETVVVQGAGGGTQPIVRKHIYPEYLGALVVCQGAQNAATQLWIVNAVSSLTGLGSDRITVIPMKEE